MQGLAALLMRNMIDICRDHLSACLCFVCYLSVFCLLLVCVLFVTCLCFVCYLSVFCLLLVCVLLVTFVSLVCYLLRFVI